MAHGESIWARPDEWERRRSRGGCVICREGEPLDVIAEYPTCWATAGREAPLPGYVCVVSRRHHVEPFHMPVDAQAAFWVDAMTMSAAVDRVVQPVKMNYEIHGNTLPHLHLHLFPRHRDDPYVGGPIDPTKATFTRDEDEIEALSRAIRQAAP